MLIRQLKARKASMIEQDVSRGLRHSDTANSDIFAEHSFPAGGLVALSLIAYQRSPLALPEIRAGVFVFSGAGGNVLIIKSIIPDAYPQCSKTRNANASYCRSRDEVARDCRRLSVTTHPTAEWVARQITEAFPWNEAPRYMIRDRDRIYGAIVTRRMRAMGIRDKPIAPASPWPNGLAERLIGSIRRECLDHIIIRGEAHLGRILKYYADSYNRFRTHRSLNKDAPVSRSVQRTGVIRSPESPRWRPRFSRSPK
jgi:transposase InsO family protein